MALAVLPALPAAADDTATDSATEIVQEVAAPVVDDAVTDDTADDTAAKVSEDAPAEEPADPPAEEPAPADDGAGDDDAPAAEDPAPVVPEVVVPEETKPGQPGGPKDPKDPKDPKGDECDSHNLPGQNTTTLTPGGGHHEDCDPKGDECDPKGGHGGPVGALTQGQPGGGHHEDCDPKGPKCDPKGNHDPRVNKGQQGGGYNEHDKCIPKPDIKIHVTNECPTKIDIKLSKLVEHVDYYLVINGVEQKVTGITFTGQKWHKTGTVTISVPFNGDKFEVKVLGGKHKKELAHDKEWIKSKCPTIDTKIKHECSTLNGTGAVKIYIDHLEKWREYEITISGPDGYTSTKTVHNRHDWSKKLNLKPGTYLVSVTSDGGEHKVDLGPVESSFTLAPCPAVVSIHFATKCSTDDDGRLGASLSGLVAGRHYEVTVTDSHGEVIYHRTFVAAGSTKNINAGKLAAGEYTVTVIDTKSDGGGSEPTVLTTQGWPGGHEWPEGDGHHEWPDGGHHATTPLSWTASATIADCPPVKHHSETSDDDSEVEALAYTGTQMSSALVPGILLIPFGAALLFLRARRTRKESADES